MKKRPPIHPRLYVDFSIKSSKVLYRYYSNDIDNKNQRILKEEFELNSDLQASYDNRLIFKKNEAEYEKLEKYIKVQKKVLEKHQKSRNYDSCRVVGSSILLMEEFKNIFKKWFLENDFII
tara:strand:+ start:529 stop:891 length:363 start_codon:yes stop_codon:yes gene_type:complete